MFGDRAWPQAAGFERTQPAGASVILAGVDGTITSMRALAYAAGMAHRQRSRLVLVHVRAPHQCAGFDPYLAGYLAGQRDERDERVDELWDQVAVEVPIGGVSVELITVSGEVFGQLSRIATECGAEVVVVGASEQLRHHFVGSLGARLVRARRWPVVVVP